MNTILVTPYRQLAETEALAIMTLLRKKGYANIQTNIEIIQSLTSQWEVRTTQEIISAMGWD